MANDTNKKKTKVAVKTKDDTKKKTTKKGTTPKKQATSKTNTTKVEKVATPKKKTATSSAEKKKRTTPKVEKTSNINKPKNTKTQSKSATSKKTNATVKKATTSAKKTTNKTTKTVEKKATPKNATNSKTTKKKKAAETKEKKTPLIEETNVETHTPELISNLHVNEETISDDYLEINTRKPDDYDSPKTLLGADIPKGNTTLDKNTRLKYYFRDALVFAILIPLLDFALMQYVESYKPLLISNDMTINYIITLAMDFLLIFITTYVFDYLFGEMSIKKKKK